MSNKNYLQEISEIKNLMNRSSRFLSLSGLSGIFAGVYALIGAFMADKIINNSVVYTRPYTTESLFLLIKVLFLAFIVVLLSVLTAFYFSYKKAKKNNENIWDASTKNLLSAFLVPLVTGGIFGLILINAHIYGLLSAVTLIFYGLALVNASKYTYGTIYYLGIIEILLGLISASIPGYGLYFWALGFGVFHIVYGLIMYLKFDRK